jgi:hypothetical protein
MAALTGVMTADFSDFVIEVDKSVVKLRELDGASVRTSGSIDDFSQGLSAADKTLGALGIHIGPQIQAIRELGNVSGLTFEKLGTWGSLGLAASIGTATYQITAMALEWSGLTEKIGDATAAALGWGDVAAERTAARLDVLSRATDIAGRAINDFDEALKIIKTHNAETAESFNTGAVRVKQWSDEIARVRAAGHLPTITQELKNKTSTLKEVSEHYGISTRALEYYTRTVDASKKAQKEWADEARGRYAEIAKAQAEMNEAMGGWHQTLTTISPAMQKAGMEALNYGVAQGTIATALGLTTAQVAALDRQMQLTNATMAATEPALGSLDAFLKQNATSTTHWYEEMKFAGDAIASDLNPHVEALNTNLRFTSEVIGELPEKFAAATTASAAFEQKGAAGSVGVNTGGIQFQNLDAAFASYSARFGAGGAGVGMIGGGPAPDFVSWALSMGLAQRGPTVNNTFNIVDTQDGIARKVGDTITGQLQQGSMLN